jgi:cytoskeleton protein RodZ
MNLGELLKSAREESRLSLNDLSEATSIRAGLLSQMEQNDFSHCGGDIYARGHLRNIAPLIGLDAAKLITIYNQEHSVESRSLNDLLAENNVTKVPIEKKRMSWKTPAAVSLFVLATFIVVQVVVSNSNSSSPSSVASTPVATASPTASPTVSPTQAATETPTAESTTTPVISGVKMEISATRGSSRIHIVADGKTLEKGSLFQGENRSFEATTSISIYFSNPAGLDVTVNGELLAPLGGQNEEVRRTFR